MDDEVPTCPLCLEDLDATDRAMQPCKCSYVVCCWCLNHIREQLNGRCPACRAPYEEQNFTFKEVSAEAALKEAKERATAKKERERREKLKELERERARAAAVSQQKAKTNLKHARFVQKNLVYVIGLSLTLAREEYLRRADMFGRFGRIVRILVNRAHPYNADAPGGPSISAYLQYSRDIDASAAVRSMNNVVFDGREIRCAIACTKYCDTFVKNGAHCGNLDCMYVHDVADPEDVLSREDVLARQLGPPPPSHLFLPVRRRDPNAARQQQQAAHATGALQHRSQDAINTVSPSQDTSAATAAPPPGGGGLTAPSGVSLSGAPSSVRAFSGGDLVSAGATSLRPIDGRPPSASAAPNSSGLLTSNSRQEPLNAPLGSSPRHGFVPGQGQSAHTSPATPQNVAQASCSTEYDLQSPPPSSFGGIGTNSAGGRMGPQRMSAPQLPFNSGWAGSMTPAEDNVRTSPERHGAESSANSPPKEDLRRNRKRPGLSARTGTFLNNIIGASTIGPTPIQATAPPGFGDTPSTGSHPAPVPPPGFSALRVPGGIVRVPSNMRSGVSKPRNGGSVPPGFESPDLNSGFAPTSHHAENSMLGGQPLREWTWGHKSSGANGISLSAASPNQPGIDLDVRRTSMLSKTGSELPPGSVVGSIPQAGLKHATDSKADSVFTGCGIAPPIPSVDAPYLHATPRPMAGLPQLGTDQGVAQVPGSTGLGTFSSTSSGLPPELRPSRRSNSRFGFARSENVDTSPIPGADSHPSTAMSPVRPVVSGYGSNDFSMGPQRLQSTPYLGTPGQSGPACSSAFGKTVKSRFDFAEKELSPPREGDGPRPSPYPPLMLNVPDLQPSRLPERSVSASDSLNVCFSQLSTEEKLASLFRSAQWSTQGLPPMPLVANHGVADGSGKLPEHIASQPPIQLQNPPSTGASHMTSPKRDNSPLLPPGFREATPESTSATADCALMSVSPGVAANIDVDGYTTDQRPENDATVRTDQVMLPVRHGNEVFIGESRSPGSPVMNAALAAQDLAVADSSTFKDVHGVAGLTKVLPIGCTVAVHNVGAVENTPHASCSGVGTIKGVSLDANIHDSWDTVGNGKACCSGAVDAELAISEVELEKQVQAARAREAQLAAQLSELQQQIRRFDNIRT